MKLKINKLNKYGDIQYIQHPRGTIDIADVPVDKNWVIKNPLVATQQHFQERIPDCLVKHFRNIPYLLSPKAVQYNTPTLHPQQTAEMMIVSTQQQGVLGFLLHRRPEKHYWQSFSSVAVLGDPGRAAIDACKTFLDVTVLPDTVTRIGKWELKFLHRPLIDFALWSTTYIFHTHLPEFKLDVTNQNVCFIPFQDLPHLPDVWLDAKLDGQQREVLNRVLGQPTNTRLPFIRNFEVTPVF
jgi:hypothetical protein